MQIGPWQILIVAIVVLVLFGRGKISNLMGEVGKGITAFKKGVKDGSEEIATTHQKLSTELGTAREVISRQLQEFQRRGWIAQTRGKIRLIDLKQLQKLAKHNT